MCGSGKQGGVENFFLSIFSIFFLGLVQIFCATVRLIPEKLKMTHLEGLIVRNVPSQNSQIAFSPIKFVISREMAHRKNKTSKFAKVRSEKKVILGLKKSEDIRRKDDFFSPMVEILQKIVV